MSFSVIILLKSLCFHCSGRISTGKSPHDVLMEFYKLTLTAVSHSLQKRNLSFIVSYAEPCLIHRGPCQLFDDSVVGLPKLSLNLLEFHISGGS